MDEFERRMQQSEVRTEGRLATIESERSGMGHLEEGSSPGRAARSTVNHIEGLEEEEEDAVEEQAESLSTDQTDGCCGRFASCFGRVVPYLVIFVSMLVSGGGPVVLKIVVDSGVDKQLFSFTDKYHVHISPNTDVLLFLGIACAIDRIHHEVEDERERRNRRR